MHIGPRGSARCQRALEVKGELRYCGGPVNAAYVRVGRAGVLTRAGTICRACGTFSPAGQPPLAGCREVSGEEYERWQLGVRAERGWTAQDWAWEAQSVAEQGDAAAVERERRLRERWRAERSAASR